ncbi:hypothetical protein [Acidicapsa acidisoli]|uniref:hypothetical protein n=1 Tax=Acidicapsa acidisoli TaxID=1615681 RepID=UPI0021DFF5E5|nr:hypothetical protein [Acidicapsa acidisoli]
MGNASVSLSAEIQTQRINANSYLYALQARFNTRRAHITPIGHIQAYHLAVLAACEGNSV